MAEALQPCGATLLFITIENNNNKNKTNKGQDEDKRAIDSMAAKNKYLIWEYMIPASAFVQQLPVKVTVFGKAACFMFG
jgi:hypothetical protein